jgi:Tol biopolymer transport system component
LRDGDDYYMVHSSFESYPGLLIWHSKDLINWTPVKNALYKNVGSVWAPDLVKYKNKFYIYFPANYEIYVVDDTGGSARNRTNAEGDDTAPAWSPDGSRIVFGVDSARGRAVLVVNGDRDPFGVPSAQDADRVVVVPGETHALKGHRAVIVGAVAEWLPTVL